MFRPKPQPPPLPSEPWDGKPVDVDQYWALALAELNTRQQALAKLYRLAEAQWRVDQPAALIRFEAPDGLILQSPVQIVGSWRPQTNTFYWAWDHPGVQIRLRADAERTRWFAEKHQLAELLTPQINADEAEAWRLAALCVKVNGASGAFRGPAPDSGLILMTLRELRAINSAA